jgi:hypothetical protein
LKCVYCGRELKGAALFVGKLAIGPVCAKKRGLSPPAKKRASLVIPVTRIVRKDVHTLPLF